MLCYVGEEGLVWVLKYIEVGRKWVCLFWGWGEEWEGFNFRLGICSVRLIEWFVLLLENICVW